MDTIKCKVETYDYDVEFGTSFIERVKKAGSFDEKKEGFLIHFTYNDEDGYHDVEETIDVKSWNEMDKIACIILKYIYGWNYATLEELEIVGDGQIMSFSDYLLMKIVDDMEKEKEMKEKKKNELKELERLKSKYETE